MDQIQALELLIKSQADQIRLLTETNARQSEQLASLQVRIDKLLAQVAWFTRQFFGRKSEKLSLLDPNQLSLFETAETALQEAEIEQSRLESLEQIRVHDNNRKSGRSTRKMLEDLPVVEVVVEPENVDRINYKRIGEERTRTLEFKPGELYVREIVRPKYGLRDNLTPAADGMPGVIIAPLPLLPIHKGLPGASLLAEILLQKYQYHLPFYRQVQQFHHLGAKIPENTLSGWFKPACELLKPLYEALKEEVVVDTDYLQVDETVLPVISKESHTARKEYLWVVRSVMKKLLFFHYDDGSRSRQTAKSLLKSFNGYLQSDGWQAYDIFEKEEKVCLVGCMAHMRRYFEKSLNENKSLSEHFLGEVQNLYRIERMADEQKLSFEERAELRRKLAAPIMESLEKWMEKTYSTVLPRSLLGEAISYTYKRWGRMKNYLLDGRLKPDNNLVENAVRPIALSRKNFLFCGNHRAAENTAIICSLLGSCREQGVNPREWLTDVIARMPYYQKPGNRDNLKKLLPNYWKKEVSSETLIKL